MRAALLILLFLMSNSALSAEMRIYGFTSSFIECVKNSASGDVSPGNSVSSIMDNGGVIPSGQIGSSYWGYMNCLSPSRSGTQSGLVSSSVGCSEINITTPQGSLYVPPGGEGKVIDISGRRWRCSGGSWSRQSDSLPDLESLGATCASQEKSHGQCRFSFGLSRSGEVLEDNFGAAFGDASANEGAMRAVCKNGVLSIVSASCAPSSCAAGAKVRWSGGDGAYCSGEVSPEGTAFSDANKRLYYPSLESANENSRIVTGEASFVCLNGRWVNTGSSNCVIKPRSELVCSSVGSAVGGNKFYCE